MQYLRFVFLILISYFLFVSTAIAETANARFGNLGPNVPRPDDSPPKCKHELESSYESYAEQLTGGKTLLDAAFGDENKCLKEKKVPESAYIRGADIENFVNNCAFRPSNSIQDISNVNLAIKLQNRDRQTNNFFQDLARRSLAQLNCRISTFDIYFQKPEAKNNLNEKAKAKFNEIVKRVQGLVLTKQRVRNRALVEATKSPLNQFCDPEARFICAQQVIRAGDEAEAPYEAAIAAEISKLPYAYEPEVSAAIFAMTQNGVFNPAQYELALYNVNQKYRNFAKFYTENDTPTADGKYTMYCIPRQYKEFAAQNGIIDKLISSYPDNVMNANSKAILQCHLNSKYKKTEQVTDAAINGAFMVGGALVAVAAAIPSGGTSLGAYAAVAAAGLEVVGFAAQVQSAYKACTKKDFLISPDGGEQCNAEQNFNKEMDEFSLTSCLTESGLAALGGVAVAAEVNTVLKTSRAGLSAADLKDEVASLDNEIVVTGKPKKSTKKSSEVSNPNASTSATSGSVPTAVKPNPAADISSSTPASTPVRNVSSVPNDTPSMKLTTEHLNDTEIKLSLEQQTELANESYARKAELDRLLPTEVYLDKHEANRILNTYLDNNDLEGYFKSYRGRISAKDEKRIRELVEQIQNERVVLTRSKVNNDLEKLTDGGTAEVRTQSDCKAINLLNDVEAFHSKAKCSVVKFTKDVENYCSCGGRGGLGSWAGPCAEAAGDFLLASQLADRDALPTESARGLKECKRIKIKAGTVVIHGGLKPTMSGHGGAAQIFIPSRGLAPRVVDGVEDASRLNSKLPELKTLGITEAEIRSAPSIEVVAVAPLNPNPEVTRIYQLGGECRQSGNCNSAQVEKFVSDFNKFKKENPDRVLPRDEEQFYQWAEWLKGCRSIQLTRPNGAVEGSSFSNINTSIKGCER